LIRGEEAGCPYKFTLQRKGETKDYDE